MGISSFRPTCHCVYLYVPHADFAILIRIRLKDQLGFFIIVSNIGTVGMGPVTGMICQNVRPMAFASGKVLQSKLNKSRNRSSEVSNRSIHPPKLILFFF